MKNNWLAVVICLCLTSCHDFAFDYFGKSSQRPSNTVAPNMSFSTTGAIVTCTNDDQCGDAGLVCYKEDNYVGVCAQIQ